MSNREIEIENLLPLPEATFHILMAVAEDDRHGYAIIQEVATRTDGVLKLSPGTLYRSIQRMLEQGLIVVTRAHLVPRIHRFSTVVPPGGVVIATHRARLPML